MRNGNQILHDDQDKKIYNFFTGYAPCPGQNFFLEFMLIGDAYSVLFAVAELLVVFIHLYSQSNTNYVTDSSKTLTPHTRWMTRHFPRIKKILKLSRLVGIRTAKILFLLLSCVNYSSIRKHVAVNRVGHQSVTWNQIKTDSAVFCFS